MNASTQTRIALFRGINVGGRNVLPMAELRRDLESMGLQNVRTYIQSGNVVFESHEGEASSLADAMAERIEARHGFAPRVLVLGREVFRAAVESNPFPEATSEPRSLHFFFLEEPASRADEDALEDARAANERYQLTDHVFYLHAPDGIARSKLASNAERYLGVVATARNYRTVEKLHSMAFDI